MTMSYLKKLGVIAIGFLMFISFACEDNVCPEDSVPVRDSQGNLIDCENVVI